MKTIRLLYVEDNATDREMMLRHLRRHAPEIEIRAVGTGREARAVMAGERFDLILLDYRLPDADGLELLKEMRASSPDLPVVMVTGQGDLDLAVAALKLGAADYVIKKLGYLDRLPVVIREALNRFQYVRARRTRRLRILYAEHNTDDVELTLQYVAAHAAHLNIETVTTGLKTLRQLETGRYDLLLLDFRMPDMNGLEILQEMRDQGIRLPVVMLTGLRDEEVAVATLKIGAMDYVVKREEYLAQLPSTIDRALAQWALAEEKEALVVVRDIARTIASTLDLNEVLQRVASAACILLKTDRSLLSFLSDDGAELLPAAWKGWSAEEAKRLRFHMGQGSPGQAAALRRPVSGPDRLPEAIVHEEQSALQGVAAVLRLSAPMTAHDRLLGVLSVAATEPRAFSRLDETLLDDLASFAAVWIENARLYEAWQQAARDLEARVKERTRQLEEAMDHVKTMSRNKSAFFASMAHELRTPLNSILGFAELLQDPQFWTVAAKRERYLDHIHQSGQHLLQLINDLLDLSKVEAGRLDLHPEPFTLSEALAAALDQFRAQADAKRLTCGLHVEQAPDILTADPLRFKQILYNLLSNAVKFTPEGGSITVAARAVRGGDVVEIAVTDTGIGIKAEDLGRLFQEFTQLDSAFTKTRQGTGLGLALTKRLVELHGGAVTAASPGEGQGSTFTVILPVRPAQASAPAREQEAGE